MTHKNSNFIASGLVLLTLVGFSAIAGSYDRQQRGSDRASGARVSTYRINPDMTYPSVSGGVLLQFLRDSSNKQMPNIVLTNLRNHEVKEMTLWFDDATDVHIVSATAGLGAEIVVSGYAHSKDGVTAKYIAQLDAHGAVTHVIRTNPYLASSVCLNQDGSVWTAGKVDNRDVPQTYRVIREWSMTTGLKAAALPYREFFLPSGIRGETNSGTFFRCGRENLFLYRSSDGALATVDAHTLAATIVSVRLMSSGMVTTDFECLDNGTIYSSVVLRQGKQPRTFGEVLYARIAGDSNSWSVQENLPVNADVDSVPVLRGVDDGSLVFANQSAGSDPHFVELVWTTP